jgi:segregation and condensation protein A
MTVEDTVTPPNDESAGEGVVSASVPDVSDDEPQGTAVAPDAAPEVAAPEVAAREVAQADSTTPEPPRTNRNSPARARPIAQANAVVDGVVAREAYAVSLDTFEGPLDLLLHLVRRHELDVLDIPISFITRKYLEFIEVAQALDIEVAGEYLVMAATLAFLKSRELLPSDPLPEEESSGRDDGVDPRQELIRRLVEYEKFRMAGLELDARPIVGRDVFPRGGDVDVLPPEPDLAPITLFRLAEAYGRILDRARILKTHDVEIEPVTVRQRMKQLSLLLGDSPRVEFEALFLDRTWSSERELRQMLVVTLMSVLEMVKLGVMSVQQPEGSETIVLERIGEAATVARVVETFREEDEAPPDLAKAAEAFELEQALAADLDGPDRGVLETDAVTSFARGSVDPSAFDLAGAAAAAFARGPDVESTHADTDSNFDDEAENAAETAARNPGASAVHSSVEGEGDDAASSAVEVPPQGPEVDEREFDVAEDVTNAGDETTAGDVEPGPAETPVEAPNEAPSEAPVEAPSEAPVEAPSEAPDEAPIEAPSETPNEAPVEAPIESPRPSVETVEVTVPEVPAPSITMTEDTEDSLPATSPDPTEDALASDDNDSL